MVINPWYSQNGDAIDLESCKNALIINSVFDAGDDAICIKSGKDEDGRRRGEPCQNVIVKNNTVLHGHGGFVVGSEMSGGVKNIYVEDCTFMGTDVGLRFKSTRGRGGVVENIYINNINMINIPNEPLLFDLFYGGKGAGEESEEDLLNRMKTSIPPVTEETPAFRNIHISNIVCRGSGRAMFFNGLPESITPNVPNTDCPKITAKVMTRIGTAYSTIIAGSTIIPTDTKKMAPKRSLTGFTNRSIDSASIVSAKIDPIINAPKAAEKPVLAAITTIPKHSASDTISKVSSPISLRQRFKNSGTR